LQPRITHKYRDQGEQLDAGEVLEWGSVGYLGYYADRGATIVDHYGLTDPFLARLPIGLTASWRPGHYARNVPAGYLDSLRNGTNEVEDEGLAALFDDVNLIHRAPLFSGGRWSAIWRHRFGMRGARGKSIDALRRPGIRHTQKTLANLPAGKLEFRGR